MTSPFRETPRESSLKKPSYFVIGMIMIVLALVIYTMDIALPMEADLYRMLKYGTALILAITGVTLIIQSLVGEMDNYYVHNGKCVLVRNHTCTGGCKKCVFALTYIQNELVEERRK